MAANHGANEAEREQVAERAWKSNSPVIANGRPGTGKTRTVLERAKAAVAQGARVLVTVITANQAARMKAALHSVENVDVHTCHAAFKLDGPEVESFSLMTMHDVVIVDEYS